MSKVEGWALTDAQRVCLRGEGIGKMGAGAGTREEVVEESEDILF